MRHPWWQSSDGIDLRQARWRYKFRRAAGPPGPRKDASAGLGLWRRRCSSGFYRRAELFRDRRRFLGDVPAVRLGVFLGQLMLDLKHLLGERVRLPVGLGQLGGGVRSTDVVGNRFLHTLVLTWLMWSSTTAVKRALAYWLLAAMKSLQKATR